METYLNRNRNPTVLALLLLAQLTVLGYQVRRPDSGGIRLVQLWGVEVVLPLERATERVQADAHGLVANYIALRDVRRQNDALRQQLAAQRLELQRLQAEVRDLPRLNALLGFQRSFAVRTVAAQVIGSGSTPDAQLVYLDRGANAGLGRNMPVITADGVVGKISQVAGSSATLLLLTDPQSGVDVLIGDAGVQGVLRGDGAGHADVRLVFDDEPVAAGADIMTSGEDQVFPKGLHVGAVSAVSRGPIYQNIQVKLAADLGRLEEVLVITATMPPPVQEAAPGLTAADIRQSQLPSATIPPTGIPRPPPPPAPPSATPPGTPPAEGDALGLHPEPAPATPAGAQPGGAKTPPSAKTGGGGG